MIAAVALMLSAGPAAAEIKTGNGLLDDCREFEKYEAGQGYSQVNVGLCLGYIRGVWDMANQGPQICSPDSAIAGQATLIVIKYLKENPAQLHRSGALLVREVLREAWPCN
jgi:hypothetical protein